MTEPEPIAATPSPILDRHEALGAKVVEFAGWLMPLRYAGDLAEHQAVRTAAGLFDLSHMGELHVDGPGAGAALGVDQGGGQVAYAHVLGQGARNIGLGQGGNGLGRKVKMRHRARSIASAPAPDAALGLDLGRYR